MQLTPETEQISALGLRHVGTSLICSVHVCG